MRTTAVAKPRRFRGAALTECICVPYTLRSMRPDPLAQCTGFDWDEGNLDKNWEKHGIAFWECEEIFLNRPLVVRSDDEHSRTERRYYALGQTEAGRLVFVAFTI